MIFQLMECFLVGAAWKTSMSILHGKQQGIHAGAELELFVREGQN
jgi:hypothetical protein